MTVVVHATTVHGRDDVRIYHKECRSLASETRCEIVLVVADSLGDTRADSANAVGIVDIGRPNGGRVGRFVIGTWSVCRAVRRLDAELVHIHDPELIPACLVLKCLGKSVIYDVHEDLPRQILSKDWLPRRLRRPIAAVSGLMERLAARFFDGIVAATQTIADRFPAEKTIVVRNFPLVEEFEFGGLVAHADRERAFVYVGVVAALRGVKEMVAAIERIAAEEALLRIAGNISPEALRWELEGLPGWSRVDFQGWLGRSDIVGLLGEVRGGLVVLRPTESYVEALPVKLFEYMAAGIPVIASDFPLWREMIEKYRCGLLVDPMDVEAIADAMLWVLDNPREAQAMGGRGQQAVQEEYNWSIEVQQLIQLYEVLGV